jgi:micrococcal nuclease
MTQVKQRKGWLKIVVVLGVVGALLFGFGLGFWLKDFRPGVPEGSVDVVRVVDGDTIVVSTSEGTEKVRLIGINTPETVDPRRPVECFGKEASRHTAELLSGKPVRLERDHRAGDRDKYGRLLRYVFLADGTLVNEQLIRDGYAQENGYGHAYDQRDKFRAAEREAQENFRGLWSPAICPPGEVTLPKKKGRQRDKK